MEMFRGFVVFAVAVAMMLAMAGASSEAEATPSLPAPSFAALAQTDDAATLALIASILSSAQDTMAAIADDFAAEGPSAESQGEFDAMQAEAIGQIKDVHAVAAEALRGIRNGTWSDEVWEAAHAALPVLRASMNAELAIVDALEYPGPTTTTSTAPPPTTTSTTVAPPTTTTSTTSAPPTTQATATSTTTVAPSTTTTSTTSAPPTTVTTTSTVPALVSPQSGGSDTGPPTERVLDPQLDRSVLGTLFAGDGGLENVAAPPAADLTAWLSTMLDVVFPPMVAAAVLSPFVIVEVIGRTILSSGSAILVPMLMLALSILFLRWRDRGRLAAETVGDEASGASTP
jgi:hypothetical protein